MRFSALAAIAAVVSAADPVPKCCTACKDGEVKGYSIIKNVLVDNCGESCINPTYWWVYKVFEWHMVQTEKPDDTPCLDHGYSHYDSTQIHSAEIIPLKVAVDFWKKPAAEEQQIVQN